MLFRVDGNITIRADRYCFMVCQDKGMTKFPKGIMAPYHKPLKFCGYFHEMVRSIEAEAAKVSDEISNIMREEFQMRSSLNAFDGSFDKYSIVGTDIRFDKDCYINKFASYTTYNRSPGHSLFSAWTQHLREHPRFGSAEKDYNLCEPSEIAKAMQEFKEQVAKDHGVDFSTEVKIPKHLCLEES